MKSIDEVKTIVNDIKYKDWSFRILSKGDGYLLQVVFEGLCVVSGLYKTQYCRKWYVSPHSCTSEIVRTALKAIEAAETHELYENFTYKGSRIFNPHLNIDNLVQVLDNVGEEIRA